MKVEFADSFWESLKTMSRHQTWWYKTYELFRYKIPYFFENIWYFRKELWEHRSWDYSYSLAMLRRSLTKLAHTLEFYGWEVEDSRMKKVNDIKRAIQLIDNLREADYINQAELELGELKNTDWDRDDTPEEREHNAKVFKRAHEIEESNWKELWKIFKGNKNRGMRGWWD
jgi:Asp-tRNA(Asn)/Glu-tRNA(Gln) amidotransferase C subunit